MTQEVYREVPKGLMSVSDYQLLARKFMWIDNNKIRIINNESIEKVIDVHNNMQELSYGTIPMLSLGDYITKNYYGKDESIGHYFFDRNPLEQSDTIHRLQRKF